MFVHLQVGVGVGAVTGYNNPVQLPQINLPIFDLETVHKLNWAVKPEPRRSLDTGEIQPLVSVYRVQIM